MIRCSCVFSQCGCTTTLETADMALYLDERKWTVELFVDGCSCTCEPEPDGTLDDLLESIRKENVERHRAILGLTCDGIDVVGDELTNVLSRPAARYERIDIQTGVPGTLVTHALEDALESLQTAEQERAQVVSMFGEGKTGDAIILLGKCLGHWHQINEAISKSLGLLGAVTNSLEWDLSQLAATLSPVTEKLSEIKSAVKSQDYVALSDILEYEFTEVTTCWRTVIESILATVRSSEASEGAGY